MRPTRLAVRPTLIDPLEPRRLLSVTTLTTLSTFTSGTPVQASTVAIDSAGDVFGTASGGTTGNGYIWALRSATGVYETTPVVLADFPADGSFGNNTRDGLVIDSKGNLFGTNYDGYTPFTSANVGTLWELPKTATGYGSLQLLKALTDLGGQNVSGMLSVDSSDNVFGQAQGIVTTGKTSSFFEYNSTGFHDLVDYDGYFTNTNGFGGFESNLVSDSQGNLYGTTINGGGDNKHGAVLEIPAGHSTIEQIAAFDLVNSNPHGQLSILNNGTSSTLFGIGEGDEGGATNNGVLWSLPISGGTAGALTTVGNFTGGNGNFPTGGTFMAADGNLYGTTSSSTSGEPTVWESANTNGVFGVPQTVVSFPTATGAYPASGLVSDGTNLFGTTSQTNAADGGTVFGVGPATIPTGGATPSATYLLPGVTRSTLPGTALDGQSFHGSVNVLVTNTTDAVEKGLATVGMYAYDGTTFTLLGSQRKSVNLKPGATTSFHINAKGTLATGAYTLLPYAFDSANKSSAALTSAPLVVGPATVSFSASAVSLVKPSTVKLGHTGNFVFTITNNGNVDTTGIASLAAGLSLDGVTIAVPLGTTSRVYKIKARRKVVLHVRLAVPKTATPGSYTAVATFTQNGISVTAQTTAFTIS